MKIFVASPVEVYHDADAEAKLAVINDSRFATDGGIVRVDSARWRQAQRYERDTWLLYNRDTNNDRNDQHSARFGNYAALPTDLGDYIELGCGPFTNTRYILAGRQVNSLSLLDPLLEDYEREHPHCTYKGWRLAGHAVTGIPSSIEAWNAAQRFDTVVMINVLPHCYDAEAVFDTIRRVIKPGSYLVFHEDPRPFTPLDAYDVGHPLVVGPEMIEGFLASFTPVYRSGDYFIGKKGDQK